MAKAAYLPAGNVVAALAWVCSESRTAEAATIFPGWRAGKRDDEVRQVPAGIGGQHISIGWHRPWHDARSQTQPDVFGPTTAPECPWRGEIAGEHLMAGSIVQRL